MREIKFRGRSTHTDDWCYGSFVYNIDEPYICGFNIWEQGQKNEWSEEKVVLHTVGQFTGLYDKNGKEIYEGDIMGLPEQDANGVKYKNRFVRVVEWVNDGFFLIDHCEDGDYGDRLALEISLKSEYAGLARCFKERGLDYAVIGNIHDNPELLKGEEI